MKGMVAFNIWWYSFCQDVGWWTVFVTTGMKAIPKVMHTNTHTHTHTHTHTLTHTCKRRQSRTVIFEMLNEDVRVRRSRYYRQLRDTLCVNLRMHNLCIHDFSALNRRPNPVPFFNQHTLICNLQLFARTHKSRTVLIWNFVLGLIVECQNNYVLGSQCLHTHTHTHTHIYL